MRRSDIGALHNFAGRRHFGVAGTSVSVPELDWVCVLHARTHVRSHARTHARQQRENARRKIDVRESKTQTHTRARSTVHINSINGARACFGACSRGRTLARLRESV